MALPALATVAAVSIATALNLWAGTADASRSPHDPGSARGASSAAAAARPGGAASYLSAPGLHPPRVSVNVSHAGKEKGLIFIDPFPNSAKPPVGQAGPLILAGDGNPVWFHPVPKGEAALDFNAQRYLGKPVLTWWQGEVAVPPRFTNLPQGSPEPGARYYIYDQHYRLLKTVLAQEGWTADLHEFTLTPRGTALFIAFKTVPMNLAPYRGPAAGEVADAEVQEVNLSTGKLVFQWDMLAHVPLRQAQTTPPPHGIWDPYHINSVRELPGGQLLISARNTWAIYDVERKTGAVLWQLGGKESSFKIPSGAGFSWQHDARLQHGDEVSVFDDGCCNIIAGGLAPPNEEAHGLVLKLDFSQHTATPVHRYPHSPALDVPSQGSMQTLANGNVLIGWGQLPYYSEYTSAGKLLYAASLPEADESYRALRFGWQGTPLTKPSVVARRHGRLTTVYVSWNGATQVSSWEVFAGTGPQNLRRAMRREHIIAHAPTSGFQTAIPVSANGPFFQVEAFGARRRSLGFSPIVRVSASTATKASSTFKGADAPSQTDTVGRETVAVKLACPAGTYLHCLVRLTLKTTKPVKVGSRSEVLTLGTGSGTLAPGKGSSIRVRLSTSALHAIKSNNHELSPEAVVISRDGHGRSATTTRQIKIKEAGASGEEVSSLY
jgi:hypothetical protein